MKCSIPRGIGWVAFLMVLTLGVPRSGLQAATAALVGWSEVGIHETDGSDVSVYSLMPPYSTIHAQFMLGGLLVTNPAGVTVTYQAVADATGSINTTSQGKIPFFTGQMSSGRRYYCLA